MGGAEEQPHLPSLLKEIQYQIYCLANVTFFFRVVLDGVAKPLPYRKCPVGRIRYGCVDDAEARGR